MPAVQKPGCAFSVLPTVGFPVMTGFVQLSTPRLTAADSVDDLVTVG